MLVSSCSVLHALKFDTFLERVSQFSIRIFFVQRYVGNIKRGVDCVVASLDGSILATAVLITNIDTIVGDAVVQ
jgi:hypothetical protein